MPDKSWPTEGYGSRTPAEGKPLLQAATRRQFMVQAGGAVFAASAVGSLLAACGGGGGNAAASEEIGGDLSMLIWEGYDSPRASAPFRKQYDVSVEAQLLGSNAEIITKLLAGGADSTSLVTPGNGMVPLMVQANVLDPMDWSRLPNTKKYAPRFAQLGKSNLTVDGEIYAAPFTWGLNTLVYNADLVPEAPRSFMDVTGPEYAGKIGIWDDVGNIQTWATVLGYDALNMSQSELDKVTDFLIDLKTNQGRVFTSDFVVMAKALAGGDVIAFGSPLWTFIATTLAPEQGSSSVKWTVPDAGSILWVDTWALPKGGPNRATAYAWIDYMIGQRANTIVTDELSEAPVNAGSLAVASRASSASGGSGEDLYGPEVEAKSELFGFPLGTGGTVDYQDWIASWKRVQAA